VVKVVVVDEGVVVIPEPQVLHDLSWREMQSWNMHLADVKGAFWRRLVGLRGRGHK
jgi:tRNA(His) 5'-end guanylyltransferase